MEAKCRLPGPNNLLPELTQSIQSELTLERKINLTVYNAFLAVQGQNEILYFPCSQLNVF